MLIRVSGGKAGIKEYLEQGIKNGRDYSRDELDERIILDGDLALTNDIIKTMATEGEKYLHVTLSFKEDHIDEATLNAITQDFKAFSMKAYQDEEYTFYAEAHLPKIKSYMDKSTGEAIERKPHIHIVIPEKNLETGERLEPFGLVKNNEHFIDAFQEFTNEKYKLASPKHHVRTRFTDESTLISRHKADIFPSQNRETKSQALEVLLQNDITTPLEFAKQLEESGFEVKVRNEGKPTEYLNIRSPNQKRGVNLKDTVFQTSFIELSQGEKLDLLDSEYNPYRENGDSQYKASAKHHRDLQQWEHTRSYELRYVNRRNRATYKSLTPEKKQQFLADKRNENGQRNVPSTSVEDINRTIGTASQHLHNAQRNRRHIESGVRNLNRRRAIRAVITNLKRHTGDQSSPIIERQSSDRLSQIQYDAQHRVLPTVRHIKNSIDALTLLHQLSKTHGVPLDKYPISKGRDGGDRIQCGNRHLNVSDFMTKEMHLSWKETKQYLEDQYLKQQGIDPKQAIKHKPEANLIQAAWRSQLQTERDQRRSYLTHYRLEKAAIYSDKTLSRENRNIALSIAQMNKVIHDLQFKRESREARVFLITQAQNTKPKENNMREEVGTVVSHKKAPYQHNQKNSQSYVVELESYGQVQEVWGKDLERAMEENNVQVGDSIKLTLEGQTDVTVPSRVEQSDGTFKTQELETKRNEWHVTKVTNEEIKQHATKDFFEERDNILHDYQYESEPRAEDVRAEMLGERAHQLGIKDSLFPDAPELARYAAEGYQSATSSQTLSDLHKAQTKPISETNQAALQKSNINKETVIDAKLLNQNLEASRLLIHFPKLKELGISSESITKTDKGDKIQLGGKQVTVTQLIKETQNLKPKEVISKLTPIYNAQEKDKERVVEYKNNYMNNIRKSISDMENDDNKLDIKNQEREKILLPSSEPDRKRKVLSPEPSKFGENITHDTNKQGHVTYFEGNEKLVTDRGNNIRVEQSSDKAIEIGLRLAVEKYGNHLDIKGTPEYKQQIIDAVVVNKLNISFKDKALNEMLSERKTQFDKGENLIAKAENAHKAQTKHTEQNQQQAQAKTTNQEQKSSKGWER